MNKLARMAGVALLPLMLAGCASIIASDGPSSMSFLTEGEEQQAYELVRITPEVNRFTAYNPVPHFIRALGKGNGVAQQVLQPGDEVTIIIWEQGGSRIYTAAMEGESKPVKFEKIRIDAQGRLFLPYVGRLRLAGKTPEQARRAIEKRLTRYSSYPQVQLLLNESLRQRATITGNVGKPGTYPIDDTAPVTLLKLLALAGGVSPKSAEQAAVVTVIRGKRKASIRLADLYRHPDQDLRILPGDKIIVSKKPFVFTVLGAVNKSGKYEFDKADFHLIDALAKAGGLSDLRANATGVFVLRFEKPFIINRIRASDGIPPVTGQDAVPTVYVVNLSDPAALFHAKQFRLRHDDTIFITNAPMHQWNKVIGVVTQSLFAYSVLNTTLNAP